MIESPEIPSPPPTPAVKSDFERAFWSWLKWLFIAYGAIGLMPIVVSALFNLTPSSKPVPLVEFVASASLFGLVGMFAAAQALGTILVIGALISMILFRSRAQYALGILVAALASGSVTCLIAFGLCFGLMGASAVLR